MTVTVTDRLVDKGRVYIPEPIRQANDVDQGDVVAVMVDGERTEAEVKSNGRLQLRYGDDHDKLVADGERIDVVLPEMEKPEVDRPWE